MKKNFLKLILSVMLITNLVYQTLPQTAQNKNRIGTFTKSEFTPTGMLQSPKDTVVTSGSPQSITVKSEYEGTSFNGTIEIDFPQKTSLGTWTKNPSRITLTKPIDGKLRISGTWTCSDVDPLSKFGYEVSAATAYSTQEGPCSDQFKTLKHDTLPAGNYTIAMNAECSFSQFDIAVPNYDFMPMTKIFYTSVNLLFYRWNGFYVSISIPIKIYYTFDRVTGPLIGVGSTYLEFNSDPKASSQTKKITLSNAGSDQLDYSILTTTKQGGNWLSVSPGSGSLTSTQTAELDISVNPSTLEDGDYQGQVIISSANAANSPVTIDVYLKITEKRLSFKFDPPKIKSSEWTSLEISVVDKNDNLIRDFNGGADVRLLKNISTEKITRLTEFQSILITNGKAQPILIFTPEIPFSPDSAITNRTALSGKIFIEVKPEDKAIKKDTAKITVYSPIDFYVDHIEIQQGVKDIDKDVQLEYKPGVNKWFPTRNFIASHNTVVRAFVKYRKTVDIPFSSMEYGLKADLNIYSGNNFLGYYLMGEKSLSDVFSDFIVKDTFLLQERINLNDALFKLVSGNFLKNFVEFDVKLILEDLYQVEDDIENNKKTKGGFFTGTKSLRILGMEGKLEGENYETYNPALLNYVKNVMPLESQKFIIKDPEKSKFTFKSKWYDLYINYWNTLTYLLNRENETAAPGEQFDCLLMFATSPLMEKFASGSHGACDKINGKIIVIGPSDDLPNLIGRGLGQILGLKVTWDAWDYTSPLASFIMNGDPNPRHSNANYYGNWAEDGNINLLDLKQSLGSNRYHDMMAGNQKSVINWTDRVTWDYLYQKLVLTVPSNSPLKNGSSTDGFIAISGSVSKSDSVYLNPFIRLTQVPAVDDSLDGNYSVEFYDRQNILLNSYKFDAVFYMPGVGESPAIPFSLYLPFNHNTKK
jgi:hypothetical protein